MRTSNLLTLVAGLMLAVGCESPDVEVVEETSPPPVVEADDEANVATATKPEETPVDMTGVENEPPPITAEPREFVAKDAKKGKKSRQAGGYLGAVANARFYAEHEMVINSYKHALNLFWGMEGHYPKSHDEFMEKIIKFNKIQLPQLEAGVEYLYDPEDHLLKVYRPEG